MPTIVQKNNRFLSRVRIAGHQGISSTFGSYHEALKWGLQMEAELKRGKPERQRLLEVSTLKAAMLRYREVVTPTKKGHVSERNRIDLIIRYYPTLVNRKLEEIEGMHIADFRDALVGSGYAPATVKRYMEVIKAVFKTAKFEWGFRKILDPTEGIRMPSIQNARSRRLSQDEFQALLASCDEHPSYWLRPYVVLAVETAMRRGELGNLKWVDVDFDKRWARLDATKNGKRRFVPLSKKALEQLEFLKGLSFNERVFPVQIDAITGAFGTAVKRARILDFRLHDLRHEAVSRLIERGLTVFEVKEITGQLTTTIVERYTHLRRDDLLKKLD